jgi:hypothetical protein
MNVAGWHVILRVVSVAFLGTASMAVHGAEPLVADAILGEFRKADAAPAESLSERVAALPATILHALVQSSRLLNLDAQQARFGSFAPRDFPSFDSDNELFLSRTEQMYRDTLRLLIAEQQVRVSLRHDVHVACELNQFQAAQREPEPALKLAVQFKFK